MEELLNKLKKMGWKPRGLEGISKYKIRKRGQSLNKPQVQRMMYLLDKRDFTIAGYSLRELASKESGLRQFCCKNKLVNRKRQGTNRLGGEPERCFDYRDYEYRIIESALKDESELEDFLLSNIKVEGN